MRRQQLLLDIRPPAENTLDNFVAGGNGELLARLSVLANPGSVDQIYLWGPPGSGRSHLLRGVMKLAQERRRPVSFSEGARLGAELELDRGTLVIVDDVDELNETAQIALFRAFNAARQDGLALLLSGGMPPLLLKTAVREDLRTRIGSALIYQVQALSDTDKAAALRSHGNGRGMRIDDALIDYLLHHGRRDLPSLMAVLDALDQTSLEQHRPITLPLLREILQTTLEFNE